MRIKISPEDPRDTVDLDGRAVPRRVTIELANIPDGPGLSALLVGVDEPYLSAVLEVVGGRPQCRELHIISPPGVREIQQSDLAGICVMDLIEVGFGWYARRAGEEFPVAAAAVRGVRRGRKITPDFLVGVAEVYRRNLADAPTRAVADTYGITHSTAAEYVRRARAAGLLPPTTPGKRKG